MIYRPGIVQYLLPTKGVSVHRLNLPWYLEGDIPKANAIGAYRAIGVVDLTASLINLATPGTNDAIAGTLPTFATATGWTFNGTSQFLNTSIVPATGWTLMVRFSGSVVGSTATDTIAGLGNATANRFLITNENVATGMVYGAGGFSSATPQIAAATMAVAGQQGYRNGTAEGGTISGAAWTTTRTVYIGANNNGGTANNFFAGNIHAVAIYNTALTAAQVAAVTLAMNAL